MRDTKRIPRMLDKLHDLWYSNPDWRFGQLVENVMLMLPYGADAEWDDGGNFHKCLFHVEDDKTERMLDDALSANGSTQ